MTIDELGADVTDHRLTRPDGRIVAWSESGVPDGRPILRVPGTPGSRFSIRADRTPWIERGLRVITTERPGYGASTRLEGRAFVEHSDDIVAILDSLGIDALPVYGASGASPHILDLAARHPERVTVATILVGGAPLEPDEAEAQIDLNALEYRLFHEGRFDEIWRITAETRDEILADPLAGLPGGDGVVDRDGPGDHRGSGLAARLPRSRSSRHSPRVRAAGTTKGIAMRTAVGHRRSTTIGTDITWWHSDGDRNAPLSAARRVVDALPNARLRVWSDAGHLTPYRHEPEILDELLSRADRSAAR